MTRARSELLRERLTQSLNPSELLITDQSQLHIGHQGARDGKSHFDITIVSTAFSGLSRIQRHQMVYDAVGSLFETDIHALRIRAHTPAER